MISDSQMDQIFRNRMENYSSSVPENMWDRIMEKKKRDRMFWLFFFRLFAIAVLVLGLTGGYFMINQKTITTKTRNDDRGMNQTPIIANTTKAKLSNPPSVEDQVQPTVLNNASKKTNQKKKAQINYLEKFDHAKTNTQNNEFSSKIGNASNAQSNPTESSTSTDSNGVKENKTEDKNDSLNKKPFVKSATPGSSKSKDLKKPEKENKQNDRKWYLDLYASPDYLIVSPHESEPSKLSYTIGIKLNRSLGKHFSIKTGIQYSRLNIIETDSGRATLHLNRLDMPVLTGYSMGKENLKTSINGGVIFSWLLGESNFFRNNTAVSLYLGINFEEKINEKLSLFAEPYYRYQLTNMTADIIPYVKFVDVVGINLGLRYYLKKKHSGR